MFVPQLLGKNPTKLRISKISYCNTLPRQFRNFLESRDETTQECGCLWHPLSLSHRVYLYSLVGQILKMLGRLRLKGDSGSRNFDKFTKIYSPPPAHQQFWEKTLIRDWNVRPPGTTSETPFWLGKTSSHAHTPTFCSCWRAPFVNIPWLHHCYKLFARAAWKQCYSQSFEYKQ